MYTRELSCYCYQCLHENCINSVCLNKGDSIITDVTLFETISAVACGLLNTETRNYVPGKGGPPYDRKMTPNFPHHCYSKNFGSYKVRYRRYEKRTH